MGTRLAVDPILRAIVETRVGEFWSPEQIAGWLPVKPSDEPAMWVSHVPIYTAPMRRADAAVIGTTWRASSATPS